MRSRHHVTLAVNGLELAIHDFRFCRCAIPANMGMTITAQHNNGKSVCIEHCVHKDA